jgi:hypothetical protein
MAKKKNSRKALAVALGIMGIAGLSLASASQLTVTPSNEVAMGVSSLFASCDNAVGITYGYDAAYKINSVTITGIADACLGKPLTFSIADVTTSGTPVAGTATMSAWTTTAADNNTYKVTIGTPAVPLTDDLGAATVIIG